METQDSWAIWPSVLEGVPERTKDIMRQVSADISAELRADITYIVSLVAYDPITFVPRRALLQAVKSKDNKFRYIVRSEVLIPEMWFETLQDIDAVHLITQLIVKELHPDLLSVPESNN